MDLDFIEATKNAGIYHRKQASEGWKMSRALQKSANLIHAIKSSMDGYEIRHFLSEAFSAEWQCQERTKVLLSSGPRPEMSLGSVQKLSSSVGTRALEDSAQDGSLYNLRILQLFFGSFNPKWWVINYSDSCTVGILWKNISGCSQKQSGTIPTGPCGDGWRARTSWQNEITGFIYFPGTCFNVTFDTFYRAQQVSTYVDYYHVNNDNNDKYQPRHSLQGKLEK